MTDGASLLRNYPILTIVSFVFTSSTIVAFFADLV